MAHLGGAVSLMWFAVAQLAAGQPSPPPAARDSTYSSAALRQIVAEAARLNRLVPRALLGYRVQIESELALVIHRSDGVEAVGQIEQMHGEGTWSRIGEYEQRVTGYRLEAAGPSISALTYMRQAWTVPVLYGNRIALLFGRDSTRPSSGRRGRDRLLVVHPLADDRDAVYQFSGGDTVVTLHLQERQIPIVRVLVQARPDLARPAVLFEGEMDLDAVRRHIVRMRGHFVNVGGRQGVGGRLARAAVTAVAFVELVNGEISERFWLPTYQRIELHAIMAVTGDNRSVLRVVTRFHDYDIAWNPDTVPPVVVAADSGAPTADPWAADTLQPRPHRLVIARSDSLVRYRSWDRQIGDATGQVNADDFSDVAPDAWRPTGKPLLLMHPDRVTDLFRFNRVEGAFTGYGATLRLRDAVPGLEFYGAGGWAWSEGTARGGARVLLRRAPWFTSLSAARSLESTNDFRIPFDLSATLPALMGFGDEYDYVDRRGLTLLVSRQLGATRRTILTLEGGPASDRMPVRRITRGLFRGDSAFRFNRGVAGGRYLSGAVTLQVHPEVYSDFIHGGAGLRLRLGAGGGQLDWQRAEGELVVRHWMAGVLLAARGDAGVVIAGAPPPQQMFELGSDQGLPGYGYKEFGGDQAAIGRAMLVRPLPLLRAPLRLRRGLFLPAPWPALSVGVYSGWTGASDAAARTALSQLGIRTDPTTGAPMLDPVSGLPIPVSVPTNGVRATIDARLRLFGGAVRLGVARAVDHHASWKLVADLGQDF